MKKIREGFSGQRLVRLPADALRKARSLPVVRDVYVTDIGHYPEARHHWVSRPGGASEHIVICNVAGEGWATLHHGRRTFIRPGDVLVIPAGVPHVYGASDAVPWKIYWVHFAGKRSADYLHWLVGGHVSNIVHIPDTRVMVDAFEETYRGLDAGLTDAGLLMMSTGLARLLALMACQRRSTGRKLRETEDRIARSIQWMWDHLNKRARLSDLARAAALSIPHYSALFKKQTGRSPMQFMGQLRLQRACELLHHTTMRVAEIGLAVGYDSPFHFSRNFTAYTGLSPRAYRARLTK